MRPTRALVRVVGPRYDGQNPRAQPSRRFATNSSLASEQAFSSTRFTLAGSQAVVNFLTGNSTVAARGLEPRRLSAQDPKSPKRSLRLRCVRVENGSQSLPWFEIRMRHHWRCIVGALGSHRQRCPQVFPKDFFVDRRSVEPKRAWTAPSEPQCQESTVNNPMPGECNSATSNTNVLRFGDRSKGSRTARFFAGPS